MSIKIGIPKGLLFYEEFIAWKAFFDALKVESVLSDNTNKEILNIGLKYSMDDMCLPVKVYTGHVLNLLEKNLDYIFVPRIISVLEDTYSCPKIMGLPDIIKNSLRRKKNINMLSLNTDIHATRAIIWRNYWKMGLSLGFTSKEVLHALHEMRKVIKRVEKERAAGKSFHRVSNDFGLKLKIPDTKKEYTDEIVKIGITGHAYMIYDKAVNMDLFKKLNKLGVESVTQEMLSDDIILDESNKIAAKGVENLPKLVRWHLGRRTHAATFHFITDKSYDGVIHLSAFACGPGSVVSKLIELKSKEIGTNPLLQLNFDEHTAETALLTRLEAFVDILRLKREKEKKR